MSRFPIMEFSGGENVERIVIYPTLEGKIAERGIQKKTLAERLGIKPRTLQNKLNGKTEFTWNEVIAMRDAYFQDVTPETLMRRAGA